MSLSSKKTYYRNRIIKILEGQRYWVIKLDGELIDLIAIGDHSIRLIQIPLGLNKDADSWCKGLFKTIRVPEFTIKEVWSKKGKKKDLYNVEIL